MSNRKNERVLGEDSSGSDLSSSGGEDNLINDDSLNKSIEIKPEKKPEKKPVVDNLNKKAPENKTIDKKPVVEIKEPPISPIKAPKNIEKSAENLNDKIKEIDDKNLNIFAEVIKLEDKKDKIEIINLEDKIEIINLEDKIDIINLEDKEDKIEGVNNLFSDLRTKNEANIAEKKRIKKEKKDAYEKITTIDEKNGKFTYRTYVDMYVYPFTEKIKLLKMKSKYFKNLRLTLSHMENDENMGNLSSLSEILLERETKFTNLIKGIGQNLVREVGKLTIINGGLVPYITEKQDILLCHMVKMTFDLYVSADQFKYQFYDRMFDNQYFKIK